MIALNSALAEQLVEFKKDVDELIEKGEPKISAILERHPQVHQDL